jgi:hypothetical protein
MKISRLLVVLGMLRVLGCNDLGNHPTIEFYSEDIREAVFRYQFQHNASGQQGNAQVYFLGIQGTGESDQVHYVDPPDELMARFAGNVPPVKRRSECTYSQDGVFDKHSGARGLLFWLGAAEEIGTDEVQVYGGYFEAGLSASGNIYTLRRISGRWVVVKDVMMWISKFVGAP